MDPIKINYTIKEQVYQEIKAGILEGRYKPGQWLQELKIANIMKVSRSPVREALQQLIGDGLAVNIPNKGVFVRSFTPEDMVDIFEVRLNFEAIGIKRSGDWLNDCRAQKLLDLKKSLIRHYQDNDKHDYILQDTALHKSFIDMTGNNLIQEMSIRIYTMEHLSRIISLYDKQRFIESVEEHSQIIDHILSGDIKAALKVHEKHLHLAKLESIKQVNYYTTK